MVRNVAYFLCISTFFVVAIIVVLTFGHYDLSEIGSLIRYDKYDLYISPFRFFCICLLLFFSLVVLHKVSGGIFGVFYPTNLFWILFVILILPGVLLTSGETEQGLISFYSYISGSFLFLLGTLVVDFLGRRWGQSVSCLAQKTYKMTTVIYLIFVIIFSFSLIFVVLFNDIEVSIFKYIYQFLSSGTVSNDVGMIAESRQAIYAHGSSYKSLMRIILSYSMVMLMPLSSCFFFINGLLKRSKSEMFIATICVATTFLFLIANGMRLRGLFYLLFLVVAYSMISPVNFRKISLFGIAVFILLIVQTVALGRMAPGEDFISNSVLSANRVVERIFLTKGYVTQQVFEYIPMYSDYRYGETFIVSLGGHLNRNQKLFAEEMNEFILGYAGTAGPHAFGEGYANFGVPGLLVIALLLGFFVQTCTLFVRRFFSMDPFVITFLSYFTVLIARIGYGDVFTFKNNGLHVLALVFIVLFSVRKFTMKKRLVDPIC